MKIDKIMKFMKMKKTCAVFPVDGTQWFSNGEAAFPVYNFPAVDYKTVKSLFSLDEDSEKGWSISVQANSPAGIDFRDEPLAGDESVDLHIVSLSVGRQYTPVLTSLGMAFYKPEYIAPFLADKLHDYDFVIRWTEENNPVLLIKRGLLIDGALMPVAIITPELYRDLQGFVTACGMSIENEITGFEKHGIAGQMNIEEAEDE